MKKSTLLLFILIMVPAAPASAEFSGTFELGPSGCEAMGLCKLTYDLKFKDAKGIEWQANAKDETDGATIPNWAQPFIGKPFDESYIKAAVIHDHYCNRHVRPWRQTHRSFYDALVELNVGTKKSKLMYYAVYLYGPKWVELIPGNACGANSNCINTFKTGGPVMQSRQAEYEKQGMLEDMREVEKLLEEQDASLEGLEKRAQNKRPNDFYYKHGDRVITNTGLAVE
ncbi:DUF1353 domain-containing protein [Nitrosospira sp. Nsp1]|uniref:DUF1353 domain-containing protein n=1 Tax=Nitrosospira sp. Nsp1 TaxID=136547 RepID=UPI000884C62C|nr:DUF1353 domain-containing protein [Nitrosospira sp. Nsp1]SCX61012.1 Protein of unknown function [Nitrosospira sp. Nsp1]